MLEYDFSSLNDKEFEALAVDLLSQHFSKRIERFKGGRDGGVDGRFFASSGNEVIIQCKHWLNTGLQALLRTVEAKERAKVEKLNPERYIFVTSLKLSRANKIQLKNKFSPYIRLDTDIFGNEDLNDLLSKYADVERRHYKLWITSTNILSTILNAGIFGRSKHKLEEIIAESNRYVVTSNHEGALKKLEDLHSVIITGEPGIGKTTLADQLCSFYAANGFEFCYIENSLNEAENIFNEDAKQIFFFDDFLGRSYILALDMHQDSHVVNFIKRVEKCENKRFVLTSRSNILNQGKRLSDFFEVRHVDRNEYEINISSMGEMDKAKILYNHIWFGDLENEYIEEIYRDRRYSRIIRHRNFNPRLIAFITDYHRVSKIPPSKYWRYIEETLSNPKDIWRHVFENSVNESSKHMTIAIAIQGKEIRDTELRDVYSRLVSHKYIPCGSISYEAAVRLMTGALTNRIVLDDGSVKHSLFNPSIADYVMASYMSDFEYIDTLLTCLNAAEAVENIYSFHKSGGVDADYFTKLVNSQIHRFSISTDAKIVSSYKLKVVSYLSNGFEVEHRNIEYLSDLGRNAVDDNVGLYGIDYFNFMHFLISKRMVNISSAQFTKRLEYWIFEYEKGEEEMIVISKILKLVDSNHEEYIQKIKADFIDMCSSEITDEIISNGLFEDIYNFEDYSEFMLLDYVSDKLSTLEFEFKDIEVQAVCDNFDVHHVIDYNREASIESQRDYAAYAEQKDSVDSSANQIDDLFDRG
ncbi:nSTAND3 domain-containing NTPase [Microbulbifer sp. PSTR4-B]|uniref:nSTAND3 domain-containing NTPase n=1 Tax=Microbulbifer sp. PSTR4-B TaxID=3243396 RepID=UPI0040391371